MALITKAVKGTQDVLPSAVYENRFLERAMTDIAGKFGFNEIRTPVFEHTELFQRGVGGTTDVVQKEMYTFDDKGGRSITLRPEGTAGAMRAFLEHGLFNEAMPQKVCYVISCYRYEKPQAGRLREFHQFGIECFGAASPAADAEVIALADAIFDFIGIKNLRLEINSIGCPECRAKYHDALRSYFGSNKSGLCRTCNERLERNPMRILDCKNSACSKTIAGASVVTDFLCRECSEHFEGVKKRLDAMCIKYLENPRIVRGLDYYTRTVFEFVSDEIGAQGTVCGGGRYDGLAEELGGQHVPSLGFALGIERLLLLMRAQAVPVPQPEMCEIYIAAAGEAASIEAARIVNDLRLSGINSQTDVVGRSVKAQMKYADKINAVYSAVLGDSELQSGEILVKKMDDGETAKLGLENFTEEFLDLSIKHSRGAVAELIGSHDADISKFIGGLL